MVIKDLEKDPYEFKHIQIFWYEAAQKEKIVFAKNGPYVLLTEETFAELQDDSQKFYALMDTLNVDFEDMFPEWGKDESEH